MSRSAFVGGGVAFVLVVAFMNLNKGVRPLSVNVAGGDPALSEEVVLLRQRISLLESKLESKLAASTSVGTSGGVVQRPSALASVPSVVEPRTPAAAAAPLEMARVVVPAVAAAAKLPERRAPKVAAGVTPWASWWSDTEEQTSGGWCRKRAPYAAAKPPLPTTDVSARTDKPLLTRELAKRHASADNMLIATYVNYNRLDFAYTFVKHLLALNNPHFLVGALDEKALRGLQSHGVPAFLIESGLTTNDYGWGTAAFRKLGLHKVNLVLELAKTGVDCLTVDADAFLLRDPFPYLRNLPRADVLSSSDHLVATNGYNDDGLEGKEGFYSAFNIGYIWIKANAVEFVQAWRDQCFARPNDWDQVLFGSVLGRGAKAGRVVDKSRLREMFKRADGTHIMAGVLPVSLFASGHTFFVSRMAHLMHSHPYMVHTTFQYGGAQGKRHRLREAMMWEDEPSYYDPALQGFLTYEPDLPYALTYPKGGKVGPDGTQAFEKRGSVDEHFALVHHQLTQIRNALALAQATNRILILPRLVCGLDRWWAPHSGIIPGSAARLPLLECPADHVIDLERMGKPEVILREANFLCNPRTPSSVTTSVHSVDVALPTKVLADGSNAEAARGAGLALVGSLTGHAASRVLKLRGAPPDYRAVLDAGAAQQFENKIKGYASLWCCNRPPGGRGAGHIWYDFFWDVTPHTDRFNRKWPAEWTPKMGP